VAVNNFLLTIVYSRVER